MPYAMYLRKSRADIEAENHGQGETLLRHENILRELAEKMELTVTEIFREVVSGETIDARPEIQRLLRRIEANAYDGVLVVDIDRLARGDTVDQGIIARTFRLSGTKIITPKKVYDPYSEFDEEYFEFELFMARREYKLISRRIQRGRLASVRDGKFVGSTPPYGYNRVKKKNGKGYTLEPNGEADTVKLIFKTYIDGSGASVIAEKLNSLGIKTRSGKPWSRSSIADIIGNPVYTGKIRWAHRPGVKTIENGSIRTKRITSSKCVISEGIHEPLISEDDFFRARRLSEKNRKAPVKADTSLKNPFAGLIRCGKCGSAMTRLGGNKHTPYDTIRCKNRSCGCVSAPIYLVEESVAEALEQWLSRYETVINAVEETAEKASEEILAKMSELSDIAEESERLRQQTENAYDLLEQEIYTAEVFRQRLIRLSERKKQAEEQASRLNTEISEIKKLIDFGKTISPEILSVMECYRKCENAWEKNAMLKTILEKIEYVKDVPNRRGNRENAGFALKLYPIVPKEYKP